MLIFLIKYYAFGIVRMYLTGFVATIQYWVSKIDADEKTDSSGERNQNKIVQRFYETRLCRSVWRKAKIPIPAASYGVFPNFYHSPLGCGTALSL